MTERQAHTTPESRSLLARVRGPGQYVGGEPNQIVKPDAGFRLALAFADAYSVGMSHHGLRILYDIANRMEGVAAERVFAPFPDMEAALRAAGRPLSTLETGVPLRDCDMIGFSLGYELAATSVLTMLDLGGLPLTRFAREGTALPLVIAGGAATFNPEPVSDFFDLFVIGEAEEALPEILVLAARSKPLTPEKRVRLLRDIALTVQGAYVPSLYATRVLPDGTEVVAAPSGGGSAAPYPVRRRAVADFDAAPAPVEPVVPIHETVHERAVLEIMRGCPNGCRFCQAGYVGRPVRERSPETLSRAARACIAATGYDEIGLLSLSSSNYSRFDELVGLLDAEFAPRGVGLSLPSIRVDHALSGIPKRFSSVRKSGLTVAPEAGTERLRAVINKDVRDADLLAAAEEAFKRNWRRIKLYFMIGLPTETDEDVTAIAGLAHKAAGMRRGGGARGKPPLHLSVSNFVPKPFTAFQWTGAAHPDVWTARQRLLAQRIDRRLAVCNTHDVSASLLEAAVSRGDRRLGRVILSAWRLGARLDAWSEHFRPAAWDRAFRENGLDPAALATRDISVDAALPWGHIDCGVDPAFLRRERERAFSGAPTPACSPGRCAGCGVAGCGLAGR